MHAAKPVPLSQSFIDDAVLFRGNFERVPFSSSVYLSSGCCACPLALWRNGDLHTKVSP